MKFLALVASLFLTGCITVTADRGPSPSEHRPIVSGGPVQREVVERKSAGEFYVGQSLFNNAQVVIEAIREEQGSSWPDFTFLIAGVEVRSLEAVRTLFKVAGFFEAPSPETIQLLLRHAEALNTEYDHFTNTRLITVERYSTPAPLVLAIVIDPKGTHLDLRFHTRTSSWVFYDRVLVNAAGRTYTFNVDAVDRVVVGNFVEEAVRMPVRPVETEFVHDLIDTGFARMRFVGSVGNYDIVLDDGHVEDIEVGLRLFEEIIEPKSKAASIDDGPQAYAKNSGSDKGVVPQFLSDGFDDEPIGGALPIYPRRAVERGIEGYATVELTVSEDGTVAPESVTIVEAYPGGYFELASTRAAATLKFKPKIVNGTPQKVTGVQYMYTFKLGGD